MSQFSPIYIDVRFQHPLALDGYENIDQELKYDVDLELPLCFIRLAADYDASVVESVGIPRNIHRYLEEIPTQCIKGHRIVTEGCPPGQLGGTIGAV